MGIDSFSFWHFDAPLPDVLRQRSQAKGVERVSIPDVGLVMHEAIEMMQPSASGGEAFGVHMIASKIARKGLGQIQFDAHYSGVESQRLELTSRSVEIITSLSGRHT